MHRSLGTHISKVRAVFLDNWEPEQIEVFLFFLIRQVVSGVVLSAGDAKHGQYQGQRNLGQKLTFWHEVNIRFVGFRCDSSR